MTQKSNKKSRRFLVFLICLFGIALIAVPFSWHFFSVENRLKNAIVEEIQPYFDGKVSIDELSVQPSSLVLKNVSLELPNQALQLQIANLELGISFYNAFKYNLNPVRLISEVVLEKPVFRIYTRHDKEPKSPDKKKNFDLENLKETYENRLLDINFVGRIRITEGTVSWFDESGDEIRLVNNLDGWISTTDLANSNVSLGGSLFRSENLNVTLTGQANLKSGNLDSVEVSLFDSTLSTTIPTLYPEILKIERGQLKGKGVLKENPYGQLGLYGSLELKDAELSFLNGRMELDSLNTQVNIEDWDAELISFQMNSHGSPIAIGGRIKNILKPEFDLQATAQNINLKEVLAEIREEESPANIDGVAAARVQVTGSVKAPKFSGVFSVPQLQAYGQHLSQVDVDLTYFDQLIEIDLVKANLRNFAWTGSGAISLRQGNLDLDVRSRGDLRDIVASGLNPDARFPIEMRGRLTGDSSRLAFTSDLEMLGHVPGGDSLALRGKLAYADGIVRVSAQGPDTPFKLEVQLASLQDDIQFRGNIEQFGQELWALTAIPARGHLRKLLNLSCQFSGDKQYATYELVARRQEYTSESGILFDIEGFYSGNGSGANISGDILYRPDTGGMINGAVELALAPDKIHLKNYVLGDFYAANATVELTGDRRISGQFDMKDADLTYVLDGLLLSPGFGILGQVDGGIKISGSLDELVADGNLTFADVIFRGDGYYSGDASFGFSKGIFDVRKLDLSLDDRHLIQAAGQVNVRDDEIDVGIKGNDVDVSTLMNIILSDVDFLTGRADLDLSLRDKLSAPDIQGTIVAKGGRLFFVEFDTLRLNLGKPDGDQHLAGRNGLNGANGFNGVNGNNPAPTGFAGLHFSDVLLRKNKKYQITGDGYLPFRSDDDLVINLQGSGDAFAILFSDLPFVVQSRSDATFSWGFGGNYNELVYTQGSVSLKKGVLRLEDVAPEVKDIEVEATLEPGNQFLHVTLMTGKIDGDRFSITNQLDAFEWRGNSEPLVIAEWGLNFGAILAHTEDKGVPLHIPGAMQPNEEGHFIVRGKDGGSDFVITGPEESPIAVGEIITYDASYVFPFEFPEAVTPEPSLTEKILESMVWDVRMIPSKDVRYVKQLPGFVDNIWINTLIDPKISHLSFSGKFSDDTFRIEGLIRSTRGTIEYLDFNFGVEQFAAEFDLIDIYPIVYGRARTTYTDSLGVPSNIYLTLFVYDPDNKQELERGRWNEDIRFRLSSDNPLVGSNEIQVLASLGYSLNTIGSKATDVISMSTDNLLLRPLFRPVERKLERTLGLDAIRFRSRFARNVMNLNSDLYSQVDPRYLIFRSTRLTLGKYLTESLFLNYSGQLEAGLDPRYQEDGVGLKHTLDLEYRIYPNLLLELQYNYDSLLRIEKEDKRVQIRHSFVF